jgi:DNA-binding LytR/AlgR family response regulator
MRILLIEDEEPASKRLQKIVHEVIPQAEIIGTIVSISSAVTWFRSNPLPDLVFMDINLADGLSFEIFREVEVEAPIIFTTAFDAYALDAFKVNSVDYLLKPVKKEDLEQAWTKLQKIMKSKGNHHFAERYQQLPPVPKEFKKRFAVRFGEHIKTIATDDVAYFYTENKINFIQTRDGKKYPVDFNLDQLEELLHPELFFRINRQFIISIHAIAEMRAYSKSRVQVKLNPMTQHDTIVSVERSAAFKQWLGGGKED